jgi:hypothetical protein
MTFAAAPIHRSAGRRAAVMLAGAVVMALPLAATDLPPLVDLPQHVTRLDILLRLGQSDILRQYYDLRAGVVPYLGWEAVALGPAWMFGPLAGSRMGIVVALVLLVGGTLALSRVVQQTVRWEAAAVLLMLYGATLAWANLAYLVGAGLLLFALAGWIASGHWSPCWRAAAFVPVCVALYLAHLLALGGFALFAGAFELQRRARLWPLAAAVFSPLPLWLMMAPGPRPSAGTDVGALGQHLMSLASPFAFALSVDPRPSPGGAVDIATIAVVTLALYAGWRSGRLTLAPPLRWPLLIGSAAALAAPPLLFGVWMINARLPLLLGCLLASAARVDWPTRRHGIAAAVLLTALLAARLASVGAEVAACAPLSAEIRDALAGLPRGARVLPVMEDPSAMASRLCRGRTLQHGAVLAAVERDALVPTLFHATTLLALRPPYDFPDDVRPLDGSALVGAPRQLDGYTHVAWMHFGRQVKPPPGLRLWRATSVLDVYAVVP